MSFQVPARKAGQGTALPCVPPTPLHPNPGSFLIFPSGKGELSREAHLSHCCRGFQKDLISLKEVLHSLPDGAPACENSVLCASFLQTCKLSLCRGPFPGLGAGSRLSEVPRTQRALGNHQANEGLTPS